MAELSNHFRLPGLKIEKIIDSKTNVGDSAFIEEMPRSIVRLLKYGRSLQFKEKPDYDFIRSLFRPELDNASIKSNSVKIVMNIDDNDEEEKLSFHKMTSPLPKEYIPNSSFTDTKNIKSFSFLKDNSHNDGVVTHFRVYSSISNSEEAEESESSSSGTILENRKGSDLEMKQISLTKQDAKDTVIMNRTTYSVLNGHRSSDVSPADTITRHHRASNIESKISGLESGGKILDNNLMHARNRPTSMKSLFFVHQSSNILNLVSKNEMNSIAEEGKISSGKIGNLAMGK